MSDKDKCRTCGIPFINHDGLSMTCMKVHELAEALRNLYHLGVPEKKGDRFIKESVKAFDKAGKLLERLGY